MEIKAPQGMHVGKIDWKEAIAKRSVVEIYGAVLVKEPVAAAEPADPTTPMPNPVTGETSLKDDEPLRISGMANANITDRVDERLDPAGCSLINFLNNPILLVNHHYRCDAAIGRVDYIECKDTGVEFAAWIGMPSKAPLTDMQKNVRSLVAQGILCTVSVGFIPLEFSEALWSEAGELREPMTIVKWELLEISIIPVPCNQGSLFSLKENRIKIMAEAEQIAKGFQPGGVDVTLTGSEANTTKQPGGEIGAMDELLKELVVNVKAVHEVCNRTMGMCENIHTKVCNSDNPNGGEGNGSGDNGPPTTPPPATEEGKNTENYATKASLEALTASVSDLAKAVALIAGRVDAT